MVQCNSTLEDLYVDEIPYYGHFKFHDLGLIISVIFAIFSSTVAIYLIIQHALHYSRPWEQKHIIRILFMLPVYSLVSFLSYLFYRHAIYFEVLRDCYEAFVIASFFTLLCHYVAPTLHDQKDFFRMQKPRNWIWPIYWFQRCSGGQEKGWLKKPTNGLTWFNMMWIGIFQYCFIRVFFTFVSLISQATDRFCENSLNPAFAHIWVQVFEGLSVTLAMYCIFQFYFQIRHEIEEHRPFMKLLCIKLVIFFSFWQNFLISFASTRFNPTPHLSYPDVKVGVPSMLLCIEMAIFAILHIFAFPWKAYSLRGTTAITAPGSGYSGTPRYQGGFLGAKAYAEAFNVWDIVKGIARGLRWLFHGRRYRHNDSSYQNPFVDPPSIRRAGAGGACGSSELQPVGTTPTRLSKESRDRGPVYGPKGSEFGASAGDLGTAQPTAAYKPEPYMAAASPFESPYDDRVPVPPPHEIYSRDYSPAPPSSRSGSERMGEERRWYDDGSQFTGAEDDHAALLSPSQHGRRGPSDYDQTQHPAFRRDRP